MGGEFVAAPMPLSLLVCEKLSAETPTLGLSLF